jgi:hypothetical protein
MMIVIKVSIAYHGIELISNRLLLLPVLDIAVIIDMINKALLSCKDVDTPLQMVPHVDVDFDFWPSQFGRH